MPAIPAIGRLRQEDREFKVSLGYINKLSPKKTSHKPYIKSRS
jgi:hypothetical protein